MRVFPGKTYSIFLIRQFLKVFLVCVVFIMGLSFIVRTLQGMDSSEEYTFIQILIMRLLEAPEIISRETLLASCMFASVYTMSGLSRDRELLALRSSGVSVYRIITPLILVGAVISGSSLLFEDYVVVNSFRWKDQYHAALSGRKTPGGHIRDRHNLIVFGQNNIIYKIDTYRAESQQMQGIMIIQKNDRGEIQLRIDAQKALWDGSRWVFYQGVVRDFDASGKLQQRSIFETYTTTIQDPPRYFGRETRSVEDMRLGEACRYVKNLRRMGLDYKGALAKLHRKIANSVTLFLVIIIGLSLGSMAFKNALVISFSFTLGMVLMFFFINEIGYTFGSTGKIPPAAGGWMGNMVFFCVGVFLLKRLRK
ncbi:MAG: LptF/LptG family permease [Spirochaetota bacterium]